MLNIKIDKEVKDEAKKIADVMGIPLGTIANILLRQFIRDKEINISLTYRPSRRLLDSIKEARDEYKDKNLKKYGTAEELFKSLSI
jgi:addiction module RelB/DinJ family antitoxin